MSSNLIRYGVHWKGAKEPICTPMDDGYWTPWHLAQAEIDALKAQNAELKAQVGKLADQCLHSDKMFKRSLLKRIAEQAEIKAERDALLAALESIVEMNPALPMGMIEAAQKAIAKARGES